MESQVLKRYFVFAVQSGQVKIISSAAFDQFTERHHYVLDEKSEQSATVETLTSVTGEVDGLIVVMHGGIVEINLLFIAARWLIASRPVYFYFEREKALERINIYQFISFLQLYLYYKLIKLINIIKKIIPRARQWVHTNFILIKYQLKKIPAARFFYRVLRAGWRLIKLAKKIINTALFPSRWHQFYGASNEFVKFITPKIEEVSANISPVPMPGVKSRGQHKRIDGLGLYLRTDYWVKIKAGGSYGHTCYVVKELARRSERFQCLLANRFELIDQFGIPQFEIPLAMPSCSEDLLCASEQYRARLRELIGFLSPRYIYERLVPGGYAGTMLAREFNIPHIIEYNGSEISMARSFDGVPIEHEALLQKVERAILDQATAICAISDAVKSQLIELGVDPAKILVNPNGVDIDDYRPATETEKRELRRQHGWTDEDVVIGFIGTFGGWHGIEVLAEALPRICASGPHIKFLLIGNGNLHHLVADVVNKHKLENQVILTGTLAQADAAILLRAADIYVSPHHRDMVDGKFFGSPTKLFEYMALAGAIVASDLEQIGEVLHPGVTVSDLKAPGFTVTDQRAVLCKPGDIDGFVEAVTLLSTMPNVRQALGANARQAAIDEFSWSENIDRLLDFIAERENKPTTIAQLTSVATPTSASVLSVEQEAAPAMAAVARKSDTALDPYKVEAQYQWDNDACGSQYVETTDDRRKFFTEIEEYRYGTYGPWMLELMEFGGYRGKKVLEIGSGIGTDLAQFAKNGADVTDLDLSAGHMAHARENFELRGLHANFINGDAENMPFADNTFDLVYSNGVIHHIPKTQTVVDEALRVLKPGGKAIIMVYHRDSYHYWRTVKELGIDKGMLHEFSMGEIMSRHIELSTSGARPLVKVYSSGQLRRMFRRFTNIEMFRRQMLAEEVPDWLKSIPVETLQRFIGWNLIIKAEKPRS